MMCIQILLPVLDKRGHPRAYRLFEDVQNELTTKFGGVTAFINTTAQGRWTNNRRTVHDDIVVIEVMVKRINRAWWHRYKLSLEERFEQETIVIRALAMQLL